MIRILYLSLVLTILVACSVNEKPLKTATDTEALQKEKIQHWIAEEEFGKAWDTLVTIPSDHPEYNQYAEIRKNLGKKIDAYEKQVIQNSRILIDNNHWAELLDSYDKALAKLPKSTVLKDQLAEIHGLQKSRTETLEKRLEILRAEELVKLMTVYDKITTVNPRNEALKSHTETLHEESIELGAKLGRQARSQLQKENFQRALSLIKLAEQLSDEPAIETISKEIRSKRETQKRQTHKAAKLAKRKNKKRKEKREIAFTKALARFDQLYQAKDYLAATAALQKLNNSPAHQKEISIRRTQLKKAVRSKIDQLYEQGVHYYSQENYSLASQSWSEVLRLEPNHAQALEYLERADRIVKKLKKLREKQQPSQ